MRCGSCIGRVRRLLAMVLGFLLLWAWPAGSQAPIRFSEVFDNLTWRPGEFARPLSEGRLVDNLRGAVDALPSRWQAASLHAVETKPGDLLRVGAQQVAVSDASWWRHLEGGRELWIDVLEFGDAQTAARVFSQPKLSYSGYTAPNYIIFMAYSETGTADAVGVILRHDRHLFNIGLAVPFSIRAARGGDAALLRSLDDVVGRFVDTMEAVMRQVVAPDALVGVASGRVTEQDRRVRRMASFARMWSEVKYNFVFLDQRPGLDWDALLEKNLARVAAASSQDEYIRILTESMALLRDGHTGVTDGDFSDRPAVRIEPVGGRPVVTEVGAVPGLRDVGLTPGMELVAIDGTPVDDVLKRDVYPLVSASTPQGRDLVAFGRVLAGEPGTTVSAKFLDLQGKATTFELPRNLSRHPGAMPSRPIIEFRELPGGLAYVALNTFGSAKLPGRFDEYFERILRSKGLIIDVRHNQGGNTENGFAVIARLIAEATTKTSSERTRVYKPTERARRNAEGWYEYPRDRIEPRGGRPYLGPVVVLAGPETFSAAEDFLVPLKSMKRATLVGAPTAGSTGQPLSVSLYGAMIRICTKWDRFPDGTEFVGVGIRPDIAVEPTRQDVAAGRDPVLERAVAFLANGGKR